MNLLNKNGGKTSVPQRNIKEKLLQEQIANLRSIHQESFEAFDRIVGTLKKMINYKAEHNGEQRDQIEIQNTFIQNLGMIEQILLSIQQELATDQELYKGTVAFRQTEKNMQNQIFTKTMKGYENFKENVNKRIHRLEKDIQLLETNGYHIYTQAQTLPPNKVLCSLKKATLEKYMSLRGQIEIVSQMVKKRLLSQPIDRKQQTQPFPAKTRIQEQVKILRQISWKEVLEYEMMIKQINDSKLAYQRQQAKLKATENAIKNIDQNIERTQAGIKIMKEEALNKEEVVEYVMQLKENVDKHYIFNVNLFEKSKNRSKSCHTIISRGSNIRGREDNLKPKFQQCSNVLGCEFLEQSIYI